MARAPDMLKPAIALMLVPLRPAFMSYVLSFIYVGIYWNKLQYGCYPLNSHFFGVNP